MGLGPPRPALPLLLTPPAPLCPLPRHLLACRYARYGYAGAVLLGLLGWGIATEERKHDERQHHAGEAAAQRGGGGAT